MLQLQYDNYTSTVHVTLLMLYSISRIVQSNIHNAAYLNTFIFGEDYIYTRVSTNIHNAAYLNTFIFGEDYIYTRLSTNIHNAAYLNTFIFGEDYIYILVCQLVYTTQPT